MTRQESISNVQSKISKVNLQDLQKTIAKKFYGMESVIAVLYNAIISNTNVILYGPGGFGKSEVVKEFLKYIDLPNSTLVGYEDMDVEALLGLPNMDKMLKDSVYETSFERSVFSFPGILILEEFLDVNPRTAMALKDILSSGGLRQKSILIESLVTNVIICSNRAPKELSFDDSSSAFYLERFPLMLKVFPSTIDVDYYLNVISVQTQTPVTDIREEYKVLAEIAYRTSMKRNIVSPRTIKHSINLLQNTDFNLDNLLFVSELDTKDISSVKLLIKSKTEQMYISKIQYNVINALNKLASNTDSYRSVVDGLKDISNIELRLKSLIVTEEESLKIIKILNNKCAAVKDILWEAIKDKSIENPDINQLFKW